MDQPNSEQFRYHRDNFPIMFNTPTDTEKSFFDNNEASIIHRFMVQTRHSYADADVATETGLTMGELSIYVLTQSHKKRMQRSS